MARPLPLVQQLESRLLFSGVSSLATFHEPVEPMAITAVNGSLAVQFGKTNLPPQVFAGAALHANVPVVLSASGGAFKGRADYLLS